jgi:hypothetical protein
LISTSITTTGTHSLEIWATINASFTTGNRTALFRLVVDGVAQDAGGIYAGVSNTTRTGAICQRITGVAAGVHTVDLQWRVGSGGTVQCRPATQPGFESANMLINENAV